MFIGGIFRNRFRNLYTKTLEITDTLTVGGDVTLGAAKHLVLPQHNDAITPTLGFGDGNTGFYGESDDAFILSIAGAAQTRFIATRTEFGAAGNQPAVVHEITSATNPGFTPQRDDPDTGIGYAAADQLSLIAGGIEGIRIIEATTITSRLSDKTRFSNTAEGNTGSVNIQTAHELHTLAAAATSDTTLNIPSGSMLLGASFTVNTAITTSSATNTWDADFITGSTTNLVTAGASGAQNTKANRLIVPEIASDTTNIQFDAPGAETFTAGIIEIIVYYIDQTSLADV